ncbi:ATP-binding cassette domain-containing protein [Streptosporangium subroseum]|uniref:ATP-binding cassette domain-containing protein n=1 Tax=Streptosporangium subroseum TaxID=106412 RepID=UPI0034478F31
MLAVDGLGLAVEAGQTIALLGPNGAGKSTSINTLLGLLCPTRGRIEVLGRLPEEAVARGEIGAMTQSGELVDSVRRLYPSPLGLDEILRTADLTDLVRRQAVRRAGPAGQVRPLAIAGAPKLLVLDEPTAAMEVGVTAD